LTGTARDVRGLADDLLFPDAMRVDGLDVLPAAHLDALAAAGLYGAPVAVRAGGLGLGLAEYCAVVEELAGGCLATTFVWLQHRGVVLTLAAEGTPAPLRDRFHLREHLDFYSVEELSEIVRRSSVKLRVKIDQTSADEIARRSRGTPRLANNRLRWVRDYAISRANGEINLEIARAALAMQGIDVLGLDGQDRKYLETIARVFHGGPVGVEAVAHTLNLSPDTLSDEVEPFLLRSELVIRTPRGRKLTIGVNRGNRVADF
jgi:hypothetical protein